VVGQIFLNLFIAIIVDTFDELTASFNMPVKRLDIDNFITCWKKYDNDATGYICWRDFDDFIVDLNESEADFFKYNETTLKHHYLREEWIKNMEFPMHNDMTDFYFYDVLALLCRHACESKFYLDYGGDNLDACRERVVKYAQSQGTYLTEEEIELEANEEMQH